MMRQCESDFVVKYYGSYFKNSDLWIVMEYCAARSVSDMMRLFKKPFDEEKIQTVLYFTLKGLYLSMFIVKKEFTSYEYDRYCNYSTTITRNK